MVSMQCCVLESGDLDQSPFVVRRRALSRAARAAAADVLTIENSRSGDEMVRAMAAYGYKRDLGAPLSPT